MNDALFESELKSFRFTLIEQRENLLFAYRCSTSDDIRKIILVLLNSANTFLKLFAVEDCTLIERPSDTVKEEMGIITGIAFVPGKKYTCRDGVHGTYVMEHNFGRNSAQEIIEGNAGIDPTSA